MNERLEFLGDAVLGLVVAETLYDAVSRGEGEGRLTEWRARLVTGPTLARVARRLELGRSHCGWATARKRPAAVSASATWSAYTRRSWGR